MSKFIPLGNKILIKPEKQEEIKTETGIILQQQLSPFSRGTILAISKDIEAPGISIGDTILYESGAGTDIADGLVVKYENIVGVMAE